MKAYPKNAKEWWYPKNGSSFYSVLLLVLLRLLRKATSIIKSLLLQHVFIVTCLCLTTV